jgi:thermitase
MGYVADRMGSDRWAGGVKHHIVLKLHERLAGDERIPYWVDFIKDKSSTREQATPEIDRVFADAAQTFWVTKEYRTARPVPTGGEIANGLDRTYRFILTKDDPVPPGLVDRLRALPSVEAAREIDVASVELPTPGLVRQASFESRRPGDLIFLPYAKALTKGSGSIKIAVLDTGVDLEHPELAGKIASGANFVNLAGLDTTGFVGDFLGYSHAPNDEVGHGTHVSGVIAARGLRMDEGVAPSCSLIAVRVLATMKDGDTLMGAGIVDNINTGIKWAVDHGADVINMSLGIRHMGGGLPHQDVIRYALGKGVTVVAASGNDGSAERYYPGALAGVIAVAAADETGNVTPFSSYGAPISVMAPGSHIYSSFRQHGYAVASGTSQAAPFVSGAIGLMKSYAGERGAKLANDVIGAILRRTSDRVDRSWRSTRAGYGLINLADAIRLLTHQLG